MFTNNFIYKLINKLLKNYDLNCLYVLKRFKIKITTNLYEILINKLYKLFLFWNHQTFLR